MAPPKKNTNIRGGEIPIERGGPEIEQHQKKEKVSSRSGKNWKGFRNEKEKRG